VFAEETQGRSSSTFLCNLCGHESSLAPGHFINTELSSCAHCGSNIRMRWLAHRLNQELFGRSVPLYEFPEQRSVKGLGLSDPESIAEALQNQFTYRNTFYDGTPRFDIRCDPSPIGDLDFLIASEVFEHVDPPVGDAFRNAARLLKPSGIFLLTVPWVYDGPPGTVCQLCTTGNSSRKTGSGSS
jgi:SAM-dependent methyltransferase